MAAPIVRRPFATLLSALIVVSSLGPVAVAADPPVKLSGDFAQWQQQKGRAADEPAKPQAAETRAVERGGAPTSSFGAAAYSPCGRFVVGGDLQVWTVQGKLVRRLPGSGHAVLAAAFSPDATAVIAGDAAGTVRVLKVDTGEDIRRWRAPGHAVHAVACSGPGRRLLAADATGTVRLLDVPTGEVVRTFTATAKQPRMVAFAADHPRVVLQDAAGAVHVWNSQTGLALGKLATTPAVVAPGGWAFLANVQEPVRVTTMERSGGGVIGDVIGAVFAPFTLGASLSMVGKGGYHPVTREVGTTPVAKLCRTDSGRVVKRAAGLRDGAAYLALNADGSRAVFADGGATYVHTLGSTRPPVRLQGAPETTTTWTFSPSGAFLIAADETGTVQLWDAVTGELKRRFAPANP